MVIRIEEAIEDLQGIEEITSNANEGVAQVRVEVASGYSDLELDLPVGDVDFDRISLRHKGDRPA